MSGSLFFLLAFAASKLNTRQPPPETFVNPASALLLVVRVTQGQGMMKFSSDVKIYNQHRG